MKPFFEKTFGRCTSGWVSSMSWCTKRAARRSTSANVQSGWLMRKERRVVGTTCPKPAASRWRLIWLSHWSTWPVVYSRLDGTMPTGTKADGNRGLSGQIRNGIT